MNQRIFRLSTWKKEDIFTLTKNDNGTSTEIKKGTLLIVGGYFTEREYNDKKYLDFNVKVIQ